MAEYRLAAELVLDRIEKDPRIAASGREGFREAALDHIGSEIGRLNRIIDELLDGVKARG